VRHGLGLGFIIGCSNVGESSVRGILVGVEARSIVVAEQIRLRDDQGTVWTFRVDPEVATNREEPQSASHLRQHMIAGDPMIVRYRAEADGLLAVRVQDAAPPAATPASRP